MQANPTATRFSSVLAVTGILFCTYYFLLVPHLEAPIPKPQSHSTNETTLKTRSPYARFFSEDSWERTMDSENLLKSDNIVMLFQNFRINEESKISSDKCTILIAPGEKTFPTEENPQKPFYPVVISIIEGAEIQLSPREGESFNPHPVEGRLHGPVTIKYKTKFNEQILDGSLSTSDLIYDMNTLQTQQPVEFSFGPLVGKGSGLNVIFEVGDEKKYPFSGIQTIRLNHLEQISLNLTPIILQQLYPRVSQMSKSSRELHDKMFGPNMLLPVTLTCDGPVVYDISSGSISFSENVTIKCQYKNMPNDTFSCKDLVLQLSPEIRDRFRENQQTEIASHSEPQHSASSETLSNPQTATPSKPLDENKQAEIPLASISAKGNVRLNAPTLNCSAKADFLEYHFSDRTLQLESNQQAEIRFAQHEFHAHNIAYAFPPKKDKEKDNKLGTIKIIGSGWFKTYFKIPQKSERDVPPQSGTASEKKQESYQLVPLRMDWRERMTTENQPGNRYLIQVAGKVKIESPQFGDLTADLFQLSLRPPTKKDLALKQIIGAELLKINPETNVSPKSQDSQKKKKDEYLPETLLASGNISLNFRKESIQLNAKLQQIHFNFQTAEKYPDVLLQEILDKQNAKESKPTPGLLSPTPVNSVSAETAPRNFNLDAESLTGEILLFGQKPIFISQSVLLGKFGQNLILYENSPFLTSEQAIKVEAQRVELHDIHPNSLQGVVHGNPVSLFGKGIHLETSELSLNCAANRIDVNRPGKMNVYFRKKNTLSDTTISWQKNLFFDGKKIQANGNVQINENATSIFAEKVQALLCDPIQLNKPPQMPKSSRLPGFFSNLSAEKNIVIQHKLFDSNNVPTDIFSIRSNYLNFDPTSKIVAADGKGILRLSHFGSSGKKESNRAATPSAFQSKAEWRQLLLEYSGGIHANLMNGEFSINRNIVGITYPIPNEKYLIPKVRIDSQDIPPQGFAFTCSKIFINQIPSTSVIPSLLSENEKTKEKDEMKLEFQAEGNLHIEDSTYSIDGHILKYSQEKNTCSVIGTPQMPVRITQQEFVGGPRNEMQARNIELNLDTMKFNSNEIMIDGTF